MTDVRPRARPNTLRRVPTEPHPANVASAAAFRELIPPEQRIEDIRAWVREWLAHARRPKPETSFVAWLAVDNLADQIQSKLEDLARFPDRPVSAKAIGQLRRALATIRADLRETRPF